MWHILLLFSSISTAVVGAPVTVTGHRGDKVDIKCSYKSGYETYPKYFCKGKCFFGFKDIMVESGSPAKDERFSLTDDTTNRVFTVTITDLRIEDGGKYWCAVEGMIFDDFSEFFLLVKLDNKTTEAPTVSTFQATSSSTTQVNQQSTNTPVTDAHASDGHVLHVSVGLLIMVIIFLLALMLFLKQRKSKKLQRVTQSGISQHVSNTRADVNVEDCDDHKYQEICELQNMSEHISTIYTTAESPEDWRIYYTADQPKDLTIYSTAEKPQDSTVYCTVDKPDDPVIYSTADEPTIYSLADKPDSTMNAIARKPL